MSSRLLAVALLAAGLAGTASAAQPKGPEPLSDAGRHAAAGDLATAKSDAEAWSMAESWTIPAMPTGRTKPFAMAPSAVFGDAAPKSFLQPVADGNGNAPRLVPRNGSAATSSHASLGGVFEHLPDGKPPSVD